MNTSRYETPSWMDLMTSTLTRNELRDYLRKAVPENIRLYQPKMSQTERTERLALISALSDEALLDLIAAALETMALADLRILTGSCSVNKMKRAQRT